MSIDVNVQNDLVIVTESSEDITVNVSNAAGADGVGVPTGGTTGQVLKKLSNTNYDTYWALDGGGVPYSGASGSVNLGPYDLTVNELTIGKGLNGVANNTALGKRTLFHNTTGNYNTAVGHEAGHNITTGQYNTAIGQSAMFTATTAGQNTAVGVNALLLATSGGSNVAVGLDTLQHITTGSSNTAIGYNAGSHITGGSTPNTTATNSVFIGRDSKAAADGQTNQIVIGQNAVGNGSNTATFGNTATTANYFTGSINGGSFVKSGGTSSQFLKADGSVDSSSYLGGSGATGQVAYWNGTSSQTGSNNLFWDAANARLGIGTNAPAQKLSVNGNISFGLYGLLIENSGLQINQTAFYDITFKTNNTTRATIFAGGNFQIGSPTSDGGQRLQVYGDAFIKGSGNTSATNGLAVQNSDGTNMLRVTNAGSLLFGTAAPRIYPMDKATTSLSLTGLGLSFFDTNTGSGNTFYFTGSDYIHTSGTATLINGTRLFWPTSGTGLLTMLNLTPNINQTGGANGITRGLYINPTLTAAADWRSIEWSNNSGWGLYGAGTANNYLGGALGIGATTLTGYNLRISRDISGTTSFIGLSIDGLIQPSVTTAYSAFVSRPSMQTTTFNLSTLIHFVAAQGNISGGATVSDQYGFLANGELIGATNNYGFFGNIPNGTNRWNLYMNGTADNYLRGKLLINTTSVGTFNLDVNGTARVSGTQPLTITGTFANKNGISFNTENGVAGAIRLTDYYNQKGSNRPCLEIYGTPNSDTLSSIPAISILSDSVIIGSTIRAFGYLLPNSSYINFSNNSASFIASFSQANGYGAGNATQYKIGYSNASLPSKIAMAFTHSADLATRINYYDSLNQFGSDLTTTPVTATAFVDVMGSTTANSSLRIRSGSAPTSPNDGDIWFDGTDLKMRIGGVTKTFTLV